MSSPPQRSRIGVLDGWRGVAILLVIVSHAATPTRFEHRMWASLGSFGVDIFFVISGYIITLRFIEEKKTSSSTNLRVFYQRRAFRILPVVLFYLFTLCALSLFLDLRDFHRSEILGSLLFFRNYQYAADPVGTYTIQFWSLSIEEHFYLLWPAIFSWLGNKRAFWFAMVGAVSCAIWRIYYSTHADGWLGRMFPGGGGRLWRTDTRFDGLMLGCAAAILITQPRIREFVWRNFPKEAPLVLAILLEINLFRTNAMPSLSTNALIALLLVSTTSVDEGLAHRFLKSRPLVWLGTISYSVYVWQQLFFFPPLGPNPPLGVLVTFPINIISIMIVSTLSFYLIERPCLRLGKRVTDRKQNLAALPTTA